ncbi:hypothetical protein EVAR_43148_1 [Eumeta japonica]|uniref:Uncharacterized protein n=1 Tax=Eumeta variegata TaxID=151549 RepID=A0A4C1XMM6_EUMVA|nr:hypothetical protein EVAR_43148_1 [Eumeta japonica]
MRKHGCAAGGGGSTASRPGERWARYIVYRNLYLELNVGVFVTLHFGFYHPSGGQGLGGAFSRGKRACEPPQSRWSSLHMDTWYPREVSDTFPAFWIEIGYPVNREEGVDGGS